MTQLGHATYKRKRRHVRSRTRVHNTHTTNTRWLCFVRYAYWTEDGWLGSVRSSFFFLLRVMNQLITNSNMLYVCVWCARPSANGQCLFIVVVADVLCSLERPSTSFARMLWHVAATNVYSIQYRRTHIDWYFRHSRNIFFLASPFVCLFLPR